MRKIYTAFISTQIHLRIFLVKLLLMQFHGNFQNCPITRVRAFLKTFKNTCMLSYQILHHFLTFAT